jgi:hypothetical protein
MNPRIDDLYRQARLDAGFEKGFEATVQDVYQKFAQLIVAECANIAHDTQYNHGRASYETGSCARAIRQHFGVSE